MYNIKSPTIYLNGIFSNLARTLCMLFILISLLACTTAMEGYRDTTTNPDVRLDDLLILLQYQDSIHDQCLDIQRPSSAVHDCGRLIVEMQRILNDFPYHQRTMMALSVVYYQMNRKDRAQYVLDELLNMPGAKPEAAILRSKIALEEGNVQLAGDVLLRQILLVPENEQLRSALASVYYSQGEIQRARNILNMTNNANDQLWILSYHNGLLAEAEKDWLSACQLYFNALQLNPAYGPARSRVIALAEYVNCSDSDSISTAIVMPLVRQPSVKRDEIVSYETAVLAVVPADVDVAHIEPLLIEPPITESPIIESPLVEAQSSSPQLIGINTERFDTENIVVDFAINGAISDVLMIQMNEPPRVILQMPNTVNALGGQSHIVNDPLVDSIDNVTSGDATNITILLKGSANIQMSNEEGHLRLYFNSKNESTTKP